MKTLQVFCWFFFLSLTCLSMTVVTAADKPPTPLGPPVQNIPTFKPLTVANPPAAKNERGYCCIEGALEVLQEKLCTAKRGTYYPDKNEAAKNCGYCCLNGDIEPLTTKVCAAKRGTFFRSKQEAAGNCTGYCCRNGRISKIPKAQCSNGGDRFFGSRDEASNNCTGWCCSEFAVTESTEEACKTEKGDFFDNKRAAERACNSLKGWCCIDGTIQRLDKNTCQAKKAVFSMTEAAAHKSCRAVTGFCNRNGQTTSLTETACTAKGGAWFISQLSARKELMASKHLPTPVLPPVNRGAEDNLTPQQTSGPAQGKGVARSERKISRPIVLTDRGSFSRTPQPGSLTVGKKSADLEPDNNVAIIGDSPERPDGISGVAAPDNPIGGQLKYWESGGVTVTAPSSTDRYEPGDTIPVRFAADETIGTPRRGEVILLDRSDFSAEQAMVGHPIIRQQIGPWGNGSAAVFGVGELTVPLDAATGRYAVSVILYNEAGIIIGSGEGHDFNINATSIRRGIRVGRPAEGTTFEPGADLPIRFNYTSGTTPTAGATLSITLYNNSGLSYRLATNHSQDATEPTFAVPAVHTTDSTFRIRVEENNPDGVDCFGISAMFTIRAGEPSDPAGSVETVNESLAVHVQFKDQDDMLLDRLKVTVSPRAGQSVPPLKRVRLLQRGAPHYTQSWPDGTGPSSGTTGRIEWYIDRQSEWAGSGFQIEVAATGPDGPFGMSSEFQLGLDVVLTEVMAHRFYSSECNGNNIAVNVLTEEGNTINVAGGVIPVTYQPVAMCPAGNIFDPQGNVALGIWLHKVDEPIGLWRLIGEVSRDNREVGHLYSRRLSIPNLYEFQRSDATYVVSVWAGDTYYGHSRPFKLRFQELPFHVFVPHEDLVVERTNPPDISWTMPPELDIGTDTVDADFRVELISGGRVVDQIFQDMVRYNRETQLFSIPWRRIGSNIQDGNAYQIKVTALPRNQYGHGGAYTTTMHGTFSILTESDADRQQRDLRAGADPEIWVYPIETGRTFYLSEILEIGWVATSAFKQIHGNEPVSVSVIDMAGNVVQNLVGVRGDSYRGAVNWKVGYVSLGANSSEYDALGQNSRTGLYGDTPPYTGAGYRIKVTVASGIYAISKPFSIDIPNIYGIRAVDRPNREQVDVSWMSSEMPATGTFSIWGIRMHYCPPGSSGGPCYLYQFPGTIPTETEPFLMVRGIPGNRRSYSVRYSDCARPDNYTTDTSLHPSECRENADLFRISVTQDDFYSSLNTNWTPVD